MDSSWTKIFQGAEKIAGIDTNFPSIVVAVIVYGSGLVALGMILSFIRNLVRDPSVSTVAIRFDKIEFKVS